MAIPSKQIGWGTESNLLWQIAKQIQYLTQVTAATPTGGGVSSIIAGTGVSVDQATGNVTVSASSGFHMPLPQILSPNLFYSNNITLNTLTFTNLIADYMYSAPFIPANPLTISKMNIQVSLGVAASLARILVYADDADGGGSPGSVILQSPDIDCSTTGTKTYNVTFTFQAGVTYWLAIQSSSTQRLVSIGSPSLLPLGTAPSGSGFYTARIGFVSFVGTPPTNPTIPLGANANFPLISMQ